MKEKNLPFFHEIFHQFLPHQMERLGVADEHVAWVATLAGIAATAVVLVLLAKLLSWVLTSVLTRVSVTTSARLDDNLVAHRFPEYLGRVFPLILAYNLVPSTLEAYPRLVPTMRHLVVIFFIVLTVRILRSVMKAVRDTMHAQDRYRGKPLDSYVQVLSLVVYLFATLSIFSQLTGLSITNFLVGMGAASAVLLLIFKDTLLGFVASIQISGNDMVRLGDWIGMPKYGADGDVVEINLTNVKILNFDKTVTTVPTYALISDSFTNFRAMQESGARRIKRSLRIRMSTVRELTREDLDRLDAFHLIATDVEALRRGMPADAATCGPNRTNLGLFRKYMERYAAQCPGVHSDLMLTVRQLQSDDKGLPIELYCFSKAVDFEGMEKLQADIFDHLISVAPAFDLKIFE